MAIPRTAHKNFNSFWSTATGWGTFAYRPVAGGGTRFTIQVLAGTLPCRSCEISGSGSSASVRNNGSAVTHSMEKHNGTTVFHLESPVQLSEGRTLQIELKT
ncbi:MAG: hypothetical protein WCE63_23765 [Acidobacteriaceae bacterium]